MTKRFGFTLAEVLITLGIIGVVAAITMPTLIQNHQKASYVTGARKAISTLENMFKKIQADEDVTNISDTILGANGYCWDRSNNTCEDSYGNPSILEQIIPKYLNVVNVCNNDECDKILIKRDLEVLNGRINHITSQQVQFGQKTNTFGFDEVRFYTADGMRYSFHWGQGFVHISFDVNGLKGPNTYGRDVYNAMYCISSNKLLFATDSMDTAVLNGCANGQSDNDSFLNYLSQNGWKMDY